MVTIYAKTSVAEKVAAFFQCRMIDLLCIWGHMNEAFSDTGDNWRQSQPLYCCVCWIMAPVHYSLEKRRLSRLISFVVNGTHKDGLALVFNIASTILDSAAVDGCSLV